MAQKSQKTRPARSGHHRGDDELLEVWNGGGLTIERLTNRLCREDVIEMLENPLYKSQSETWLRLCDIEDILGDEYDLAHLRELIQADREGRCILISDAPKPGDLVYYRDEDGSKEYGVIGTVFCEDGKLNSFSVDFEDSDFDEFKGEAWGSVVFPDDRGVNNHG